MGDDNGDDGDSNVVVVAGEQHLEDSIQHLAKLALNLSAQDWHDLGKQQQQQSPNGNATLTAAQNLDDATERIVALLLVRIVAVIMAVEQQQQQLDFVRQKEAEAEKSHDKDQNGDGDDKDEVKKEIVQPKKYPSDYSTTTLCQAVLHPADGVLWPIVQQQQQREGKDKGDNNSNDGIGVSSSEAASAAAASTIAPLITIRVLNQLRQYVRCMLMGYNDLPFHNFHHCYHVVLSANKLLDLMLHVSNQHDRDQNGKGKRRKSKIRNKTYGLRSNPTALLALMFAALIHDVGHSGVNNRQRVAELSDDLALRYNDQSIHENYSLHVAFSELMKPEYAELRRCMFPGNGDGLAYRTFRKLVIHVVLATDLTSPERLQLSASMFQEAYPDYFDDNDDDGGMENDINNGDEYKFADGLDHDNVDMDDDPRLYYDDEAGGVGGAGGYDAHRRSSLRSMGSMPRAVVGTAYFESSRRGSTNSVASDITMDSYTRQAKYRHVEKLNQKKNNNSPTKKFTYGYHARGASHDGDDVDARRYSLTSAGDHSERSEGDSMLLHARYVPKTQPILSSQQQPPQLLRQDSDSLGGSGTGEGGGGGKLPSKGRAHSMGGVVALDESVKSLNSGSNLESIAADSMALTQQRKEGKSATRHTQGFSPARLTRRRRRASTGDNNLNNSINVDDDDDGSLSLTPPSSEDELDGFVVTGITLSTSADHVEIKAPAKSTRRFSDTARDIEQARGLLRRTKSTDDDELLIASMRSQQQQQQGVAATPPAAVGVSKSPSRPISTRRASTGNYNPSRFGRPMSGQKIIEEGPADLNDSGKNMDWSPSASLAHNNINDDAPTANLLPPPGYFRKHLGIRRSMDFSGEALEQYSKSSCGASVFSEVMDTPPSVGGDGADDDLDDEPNELRMTVVIEVFLKVADVAHWFQDWHVMVRFNSWLFHELCVAHAAGRGFDPRPSWFENQIKAMEQYVLPLADQFCHLGVLTPEIGASFPATVERNRSQWIEEGGEISQSLGSSGVEKEAAAAKKKNEKES